MKKLYVSMFILIAYTSQAQNVGIGTTTPNYPLTVVSNGIYGGIIQKSGTTEIGFYASPGIAFMQTWSATDLNFSTSNGYAKMTISNANGFVGINTTLPSAPLDVSGAIRIRSAGSGTNKVLTSSDATGNAAWGTIIRTEVFSVGSAAFQPEVSSNSMIRSSGSGGASYFPSVPGYSTFLVAPVNLPQGATVTQVTVFFKDNSPNDFNLSFEREELTVGFFTTLASGTTTGASTLWRSLVLTPSGSQVIDNTTGAYEIRAYGNWPNSSDFYIKGAVINYTYTLNN